MWTALTKQTKCLIFAFSRSRPLALDQASVPPLPAPSLFSAGQLRLQFRGNMMKRIAKTTVAVALLIGTCAAVWNLIPAPSGEKAFADDIVQQARKQEGAAERATKYPPATARLFIASSDGSGMRQLDVLPEYAYHGSPRWAPD